MSTPEKIAEMIASPGAGGGGGGGGMYRIIGNPFGLVKRSYILILSFLFLVKQVVPVATLEALPQRKKRKRNLKRKKPKSVEVWICSERKKVVTIKHPVCKNRIELSLMRCWE